MSYLGVPPFGQTVRTITESLATAGQTTFSPSGGYLPGYIDVFLNGSALGAADFTATNGSTVVLNVAAALNDEFKAIAYWPVSLIDTYRKAEADALLAARVGTTSSVSMRNRIINGDMRIDQRNAGAALTLTASTSGYPVDRLRAANQTDGTFTVQQSSVVPVGFTNSVVATVTATDSSLGATQYAQLEQRIEGFNVADLGWGTANAQSVTISFQVRSSLTGTFCVALHNSNGSRCYVAAYTINTANTWESKTITVPGDTTGTWLTTNGIGINLIFTLAVGSTYQQAAGSWGTTAFAIGTSGQTNFLGTSGATFYITGVQLEAGTVASPFERRDYGRELMMCQRYYEKSFPQGIAPANGGSSTTLATADGSVSGMAQNRIGAGPTTQFKVPKRAIPTMTKYGNSSGDWIYALQNSSALVGNANSGLGRVSESAFTADQQIVDGTAIFVIGHWTASAEL